MIINDFLEAIFDRIKINSYLGNRGLRIANFIPPDQSPPFIEVKILIYNQAAGQKTMTIHINFKIVSAYCGDQELQKLQACLVHQLTRQPFKDKEQRYILQGRLIQSERNFENNGRIQIENMTVMFFVAPLH